MLRSVTLLTLISVISDSVVAFNDRELQELREVMQQFHEDYNQGNMSGLTSHFKVALDRYGDGHQSASSSYVQSFLSKLESDGELRAMQKLENEWNDYTESLGKHYDASENSFRMSLFESNELLTEQQNRLYDAGVISYKTGLNEFADLTDSEFRLRNGYIGLNDSDNRQRRHRRQVPVWSFYDYDPREPLPGLVDWSKSGYVTPIRNQGECASCYAFAAAAALESYYKRKAKKLLTLSPQNIVDCTWNFGNLGCNGGYTNKVFEYAKYHGVTLESRYPYTGRASHCQRRNNMPVVKDEGYYRIRPGDEQALKSAVAKHGPVVVAVSGYQYGFRFYRSGIYSDVNCRKPDHAVLLVGYGTHPKYGEYWIIKNSWGTHWGVNGYGYIARNKGNMCFIATAAMFPK